MEKQFIKKLMKYEHIIIYGAGLVGGLMAKRLLLFQQLSNKIVGFAVSKKTGCDSKINGLYIYDIKDLKQYKESAVVMIATMPVLHDEIRETLENDGFKYIGVVTKKLYESFCRNYISDFQKKYPVAFPENAKKRILFMASDNNKTSGAFLCMVELCEMLKERDIAALIVLPEYGTGEELLMKRKLLYTYIPSKNWGYEISRNGDYLGKLCFIAGLLSNYKAKARLMKIMKDQSVHLLHCNTTYTYIGAAAAKFCKIPFIWHLRENMSNQGYRIFAQQWALKLMQEAGKIIAVSEYIKKLAVINNPDLISVIYDAIEPEKTFQKRRKILERKIVRMIIVGVITPYKGQEELIEACHILLERGTANFHLQIVGTGEKVYVEKLREKIRKCHLEKNISFYGVSNNVNELYGQSDLAFSCGAKEAYGRVTIEAMLSGCLVIGINSGATPELLENGKTGMLYDAGSTESLAACIAEVISDPEKANIMAENGQNYAYRTYTKANNLRQILAIYNEVLHYKTV